MWEQLARESKFNQALPPNATGLERGCVQSTSRSTWKSFAASGVFQQAGFAKLLRLVFDTAALRGQCPECARSIRRIKNKIDKSLKT